MIRKVGSRINKIEQEEMFTQSSYLHLLFNLGNLEKYLFSEIFKSHWRTGCSVFVLSYSTLSVLSYLHLFRPYRTKPSPFYRISTYSVHIVLHPLRSIVSSPISSILHSTLSVLSYLHLLRQYRTQPSPSYRISTYSVDIVLNPLRPIVSPPIPSISYSTLSFLSYLHLLRPYRTQPSS